MIDEQLGTVPFGNESQNPKELFELEDIDGKTELNPEQVIIASKMRVLSRILKERYDIDILDSLLDNFLRFQISKDRQSRKEFVSAMQSENSIQNNSLLDKISIPGLKK